VPAPPRLLVLVLALALALGGCGSCAKAKSPPNDAGVVEEAPVPAPDGLLFEAWLRAPDAAWGRLQRGASGALAILPPNVGQLVCGLAGLDSDLAPLVDGSATSFAVVAERGHGDLAWVIALPMRDDARAATLLLSGDVARYAARTERGLRIVSRLDMPLETAVALAHGWLLLARDESALLALGPYAARTMPTKPSPPSTAFAVAAAPRSAMAGAIAAALAAQWDTARAWLAASDQQDRANHGGRAPDFGDSRAILETLDAVVRKRVAWVAGAQGARLELDIADDHVRADLTVAAPAPESSAQGESLVETMHPGDARPLAQVPSDALLALLVRDDAAGRTASARDMESALETSLGDRLKHDDARAARAALDDWARGRGDWLTASLAWGGTRGLWIRTPAADAPVATRAVRELVGLVQRPAFGDFVAARFSLGPPSIAAAGTAAFGGGGGATVATFSPRNGPRDPKASAFGVAWGVRDEGLSLAIGDAAAQLLAAQATPKATLGDDPLVARAIADLGSDAAFSLVAQPLRLDPARGQEGAGSAPAVVAVGRRGGDLWARVEIADPLLRELVRLGAGF
jgi:hypothetical protein